MQLVEEIESLRSQLSEAWSQEEFDKKEEHWKKLIRFANGQTEKAKHDLKKAEQERDHAIATIQDTFTRLLKVTEANTAMREALETTYHELATIHQILDKTTVSEKDSEDALNRVYLLGDQVGAAISRYPKEGE